MEEGTSILNLRGSVAPRHMVGIGRSSGGGEHRLDVLRGLGRGQQENKSGCR